MPHAHDVVGGLLLAATTAGAPARPAAAGPAHAQPGCQAIGERVAHARIRYWLAHPSSIATSARRFTRGLPEDSARPRTLFLPSSLAALRAMHARLGLGTDSLARPANGSVQDREAWTAGKCAHSIAVSVPDPATSVFVGPARGDPSRPWCPTRIAVYDLSFDGGRTWYPLPFQQTTCAPAAPPAP